MVKQFLLPVIVLSVGISASWSEAHQTPIKEALKGSFGPATYTIKELPSDFKALDLSLESDNSGYAGLMALSVNYMRGGNPRIDYLKTYWTNGSTEATDAGNFLIAYTAAAAIGSEVNSFQVNGAPQEGAPVSSPPVLRMVLIKLSGISTITPRPDLTKAGWEAQYANSLPVDASRVKAEALSHMKQIAIATSLYVNDCDDVFPEVQDTAGAEKAVYPYLKSFSAYKSLNPAGGSIRYNVHLSGVSLESILEPPNTVLWYDSLAWPDGMHLVAFVDGHAKFVDSQNWTSLQASLRRRYPVAKAAPAKVKGAGRSRGK